MNLWVNIFQMQFNYDLLTENRGNLWSICMYISIDLNCSMDFFRIQVESIRYAMKIKHKTLKIDLCIDVDRLSVI